MKSFALATILLSATAFAFPQAKRFDNSTTTDVPPPPPPAETAAICSPGRYQCHYSSASGWGWDVCDVSYKWVNGGSCAPTEVCTYNTLNGSPYCVSSPKVTPDPAKECYPDTYQCAHTDALGWYINTCDASGHWKRTVDCLASETCTYGAVHGYPYCTPKVDAKVCTPATYQCKYDTTKGWGWEVCTVEGKWVWGGECPKSETCVFNPLNGSPYCL